MTTKVCVVTGANSGIGRAIALGLASIGARVVMVCRDENRGRKAREAIAGEAGSENVDLMLADLSLMAEVRRLAERLEDIGPIDVLVNSAALVTRKRQVTREGLELQFAVNHMAYFLLTNLLLENLIANAPARVVNVASSAHKGGYIHLEDLQFSRDYNGWQAYRNSKLANVLFTYELARRLDGTGVTANCYHPGVIHTGLMRRYSRPIQWIWNLLRAFFQKPAEGAETGIYLAASPEVAEVSGKYFVERGEARSKEITYDEGLARRFWEVSEKLAGLSNR